MYRTEIVKSKKNAVVKVSFTAVVFIGVFFLGLGVGNGKIALSLNSRYHKSVQKNAPANLDYSSVESLYDRLRTDFDGQLDHSKLMDGLRSGLVKAAGDPYTEYFNPSSADEFNKELSGTFTGIGVELGKDENNIIIVVAPLSGFPAEKAGLKPKDIIAEIDGKSAYDISISEAVTRIRGPRDTTVKLKLVRDVSQVIEVSIVRQEITVPSVTSRILDGNIGYIKISRFSEDTLRSTLQAATVQKEAGIKGMILDMRSNPGGLVDVAVGVSGLWLPKGKTVLSEKRSDIIIRTYYSSGPALLANIPTVVLIDEGSASASEIIAGALRDNAAATLFGAKSFGKGSVQQLENLPDGSLLKVTIARWFTPANKNIDKEGIKPDTEIIISDVDKKNGKDTQLEAAITFLKK